jgi:queuine tRNA-ribosyltransferase
MATRCCSFEVSATCGEARAGTLVLPHGRVETPTFMPVGTRGTVRGVDPDELVAAGAQIVLANAYHLWVRPGHRLVEELGGLHGFMGWNRPILTDSGGYQVFSMRDRVKVTEEGVRFRSAEDGQYRMLTPEVAVEVQESLGVDVAMALDECIEHPADRDVAARKTERTTRWLRRALANRRHPDRTALFGIVQGGTHPDLRVAHADELTEMDLDGYAVGGLSVGEGSDVLVEMVGLTTPRLPGDRVRYLMGVGHPIDLVRAVRRGIDLFDCVLPTRAGRHGQAYTSVGKLNLRNGRYTAEKGPVDPACACPCCLRFDRAYLRHLVKAEERLAERLLSVHNLAYYLGLLARVRAAIVAGDGAGLDALEAEALRATTAV